MTQENIEEEVLERKYIDACKLQEAVGCVVRFERKAKTLRSAARKFGALGDYKDAKTRAEQCRNAAELAEQEGLDSVYISAKEIENTAKNKHDYISAMEQYRRLKKRDDYETAVKPHIQACKRQIEKLERRAAWKRRIGVLIVLFVLVVLFMQTSLYPFVKGYFHRNRGQYDAAIADFKASNGLPWQEGQLHKTYYYKGKAYLDAGKTDKAMHYMRLAKTSKEAQEELLLLELEEIRGAQLGDTLKFGSRHWLVLDKTADTANMIVLGKGHDCPFDKGEAKEWQETTIYQWLNTTYRKKVFSTPEKHALYKENREETEPQKAGDVTLLNSEQYLKYQNILMEKIPEIATENWWLKDETDSQVTARFVNTSGAIEATRVDAGLCKARPVIAVNISK